MIYQFMDWTSKIKPEWVGTVIFIGTVIISALFSAYLLLFLAYFLPVYVLPLGFSVLFLGCLIYGMVTTWRDFK